ncbi:MAG: hypothetical protein IMZ53_15990, partial [Thermoplasmata archaeon]|nr:hypothetical protein [Thermoplasmata archaeon]
MTKKPKTNKTERVWKRMHGFALAEKKEWERLIENPELIKEVQNLRDCYGLPLPECKDLIQSYRDYYAWMEVSKPMVVKNKNGQLVLAEHMLRFERFSRDKEKLETQFNIPKKFQSNLHNWIC